MHIHVHNEPNGFYHPITEALWRDTGITGHRLTIGSSAAAFRAVAATVEILIVPPHELKRLDLSAAGNLKIIQSTSAGVDTLRPFDMIPPGVMLLNNRGTHSDKAGEYAAMAILMLVNHMPLFATRQRQQVWQRHLSTLARSSRLTIVGLGSLGGGAARQAKQLGMTITGIRTSATPHPDCDRTLTFNDLDTVLPETDILLLACPLTDATENLLSAERLKLLPAGAGVINIGRGRLIDQPALLDALEQDRLAGAILDVVHPEPLPPNDRAWTTKNLILTPHVSSDDPVTYNSHTLAIFAENLRAFEAGLPPPTLVDLSKGY